MKILFTDWVFYGKEDIKSAMLRLQQSCMHYRDCLIKSYGKDEEQWQGQEKQMRMN